MENQTEVTAPKSSTQLSMANRVETISTMVKNGKMTIIKAICGQQISVYVKENGFENMQLVIAAWILDLAVTLNLRNNITELQAADIAAKILRDYWWMKLAEIALFLERCKDGQFGTIYARLDRATIIEWLEKYSLERTELIHELHQDYKREKQIANEDLVDEFAKHFPDSPVLKNFSKPSLREKLTDPEFRERYRNEFLQPKTEQAE